jgi:tetrapyrrole methylase family protein/MazG family protein
METNGITLLGLGPGDAGLLTRLAWEVLTSAQVIYLRTRQHPTVAAFPPGLQIISFDELYETETSFERLYEHIIAHILALGQRPGGVIYAVPGHPFVAEATCPEISRRAQAAGIALRVVEGLSFLEPLFRVLGVDPFPQISLVDALELAVAHHPTFPPNAPAVIAQIYSKAIASDVKLTLMEVYPDTYPVKLVHGAGTPEELVEELPLFAIDQSKHTGLITSLYLPPLNPLGAFEALQETVSHLRAPEGCPWDREQTHPSMRASLLEETYEVLAALDTGDPKALREELGDLLFQIVFHAQIAAEDGEFTMEEVIAGINAKLIRRHPHVFGDVKIENVRGVLENWERLKAAERQANGKAEESLLDGVAQALPALLQAEEIQRRAARIGFDWPTMQGVFEKVMEEFSELRQADSEKGRVGEIGDLLFSLVNLARWYGIDAESALRETNARFRSRFASIEKAASALGRQLADMSLAEMDALWEAAKTEE